MYPSRKDFNFRIAVSDPQLWAIGMVATTWTMVERTVRLIFFHLTEKDSEEQKLFNRTYSFAQKLDQLEAVIRDKMKPQYVEIFLKLINETRNTQNLRDRIIHNMWGDEGKTDGPEAEINDKEVSNFDWMSPRPPNDWKLDFEKIKAIAIRIGNLSHGLMMATIIDEKGEKIIMGDALRRKMRN